MDGKVPAWFPPQPAVQKPDVTRRPGSATDAGKKEAFAELYRKELKRLTFSTHAVKRLEERNIALNDEELDKLSSAARKAAIKGGRDVLILYGGLAFITSTRNHTVVTALDGELLKEHVFTNIDSAVILK